MSPMATPTAPLPPWATEAPGKVRWVTVREFSEIYNRTPEWARQSCANGAVIDFGFRLYRDQFGHHWIAVPIN